MREVIPASPPPTLTLSSTSWFEGKGLEGTIRPSSRPPASVSSEGHRLRRAPYASAHYGQVTILLIAVVAHAARFIDILLRTFSADASDEPRRREFVEALRSITGISSLHLDAVKGHCCEISR